jgi:hypothetical protein
MLLRLCDDDDEDSDNDSAFLKDVVISVKVAFHVSSKVNWHDCPIWGSENSHEVIEHECGTPKLNVMCPEI